MPIEKKKNLLIPLNNPRPPTIWARIIIAILCPPLLVLGFVFGSLYKLCFGWLDKRMARQSEQRFAEDIRTYLAFLFWSTGQRSSRTKEFLSRPASMELTSTVAVGNFTLKVRPGSRRFLGQSRFC